MLSDLEIRAGDLPLSCLHPHRLPRSQPASGLRRQSELCQQAASSDDLTAQNGVVTDARGMVTRCHT